jgi:ATP-dependent DNA helicase RecG
VGEKVGGKVGERLVEKVGRKLSKNQVKILKLMLENKYISKKEISEKIGISTTAVDKNSDKLKQAGIIKRIGPAKGGHWEVKE